MAFYNRLVEIRTLPNTIGTLFTQPSGKISYVRTINIHNGGTSAENVKLYKVPDNAGAVGVAGIGNCFYEESIPSLGTRIIEYQPPGLMLIDVNETIQGITSTNNTVTIEINGGQENQ